MQDSTPASPLSGTASPARPSERKRRTALACQRCKSRKQKCNGTRPACSTCRASSADCRYVPSTLPRPTEQRQHIEALKERIVELERSVALSEGHPPASNATEVGGSGSSRPEQRLLGGGPGPDQPESPLARTIRDLTLNASGYSYLGGTSNITLARLLETALMNPEAQAQGLVADTTEGSADPLVTRSFPRLEVQESDISPLLDPTVERLFTAYVDQVAAEYPIIHSRKLREMHARRGKPRDLHEVCTLHLVYAIGGITLELSGIGGKHSPDQHYEAAMAHRAKFLRAIDRNEIRYLALASLYCLRAPRNPGPWTMIGLAVKMCISLGLHRRSCTSGFGIRSELDKRLFWTCYMLDQDITLTMGRPPSMCDHDIDTQLPLDVDEDTVKAEDFRAAMRIGLGAVADPPTSLTYMIHSLRLKRIKSAIQHEIYRVDTPVDPSDQREDVFLARLQEWKSQIPQAHCEHGLSYRLNHYMIQYHACIRFLLFPRLVATSHPPGGDDQPIDEEYLRMGIDSSAAVCVYMKQTHQQCISSCYTPLSTMSLFLAGLTILLCLWRRDPASAAMNLRTTAHEALADCTIMLYVITERWRPADRYRRAFETLKLLILSLQPHPNTTTTNNDDGSAGAGLETGAHAEAEARSALDFIQRDLRIDAFSSMIAEVGGVDFHQQRHPNYRQWEYGNQDGGPHSQWEQQQQQQGLDHDGSTPAAFQEADLWDLDACSTDVPFWPGDGMGTLDSFLGT